MTTYTPTDFPGQWSVEHDGADIGYVSTYTSPKGERWQAQAPGANAEFDLPSRDEAVKHLLARKKAS